MTLTHLHEKRYIQECQDNPKSTTNLHLTLREYKTDYPDLFCLILRVTPGAFDSLLSAIKDHDVFSSNSHNKQAPVKGQLAVAPY
jgi:hypothetical protein